MNTNRFSLRAASAKSVGCPHGSSFRSFGHVVLMTVSQIIVAAFLFSDAAGPTAAAQDTREPITWEHVYGSKRISDDDPAPKSFDWLNEREWYRRTAGDWQIVDAVSGETRPFFDEKILTQALLKLWGDETPQASEKAQKLVKGGWALLNAEQRLAVFRHEDTLIRLGLDGDRAAVVRDLPKSAELLTFSPTGNAAAFVHNNELRVADFETLELRQLTHDASAAVRNGKADWVYFEEVYHRSWQAFRFSPSGTHILYQQFDDTHVPDFRVIDHSRVQQQVETESFPKAGEKNPVVRIGVVPVKGGPTVWMKQADEYDAADLLITHFDWLPDSTSVYWYAQNRIQTWLDILKSDIATGDTQKLLRDQNEAWVNHPGGLTFLRDGSVLFFSERTGWKHLYRAGPDGNVIPVTAGEWEVRKLEAVSAEESYVVVSGTHDSPIAENAYRIPLQTNSATTSKPETAELQRLTPDDGHHVTVCSPDGKLLVDSWSTIHSKTSVVLRDFEGKVVRRIHSGPEQSDGKYRRGTVRLTEVPMADNSTTTGILVEPPDFDPNQRHPVWLMTYGGPHYPGIKNSWRSRLQEHMLANLGIVVLRFDPRSASGYGAKSAWIAYKRLGVEEARDVEAVCRWLSEQPWADADRIGMSGHSYGGYYTAYAMTHTDCLCAGIAGAPVTDWRNYDTIYTERYMQTPQMNPDGYRDGSVVTAAGKLHGRLLILHGLRDDNVHPANTFQLVNALQKSGKSFDLMLYPEARHGIGGRHYDRLLYDFILAGLGVTEHSESSAR
ncbi:MAG: DPP IV N-terminal domain-containing protein [Planctomycetaceae bacterium]|nr:DPP IV N-terminal domain-containing protein [Planctomycetaceae bacterium]